MTWTINNPPDIIKNKSKEIIQACVTAANAALTKGLTQEEAVFAAMGVAKRLEQSSVVKQVKPKVPQHVQALLNRTVEQLKEPEHKASIDRAFLGKSALPSGQERTLVSADFNSKNQLVLLFNTGEQLITKSIDIDQSVQQYLNVSTGGSSGSLSIDTLSDVEIITPQNNDVLMYESSTGLWKNKAITAEGDEVQAKRVDFVGEDIIYRAEAAVGTANTASLWRIHKLEISPDGDVSETWASGNASYNKIWDDRLTYAYS